MMGRTVEQIGDVPASILSVNSSCNGSAEQYNLLCLFGDLAKHIQLDFSVTVSL